MRKLISQWFVLLTLFSTFVVYSAERVSAHTRDKLHRQLPMLSLSVGSPVLIRTFKQESQLELWVKQDNSEQYFLFRSYPICFYSGGLGPKQRQGDKMTPEGFYAVTRRGLQPNSRFHLALNIGYPNRYDRHHGRTGSLLMIHGACDAIGCFAMTNEQIEEIYYLVEQALLNGQAAVPVHAFPFRLNAGNMMLHKGHRWFDFWQQLKQGYDYFNQNHTPPTIDVVDGRYVISGL